MTKYAERLRASVVRIRMTVVRIRSYGSRTNSNGSRATIARHLQHLSDICPSPKSLFIAYVVRTAAVRIRKTVVRIRTAAVRSKQIASRWQGKWACRNPPCDVASDRICKFVRQPYDILRIPCVSNRKRSQGCRSADVNKSLIYHMNP